MNEENKNIEDALTGQVLSVWMSVGFLSKAIYSVLICFGVGWVIAHA